MPRTEIPTQSPEIVWSFTAEEDAVVTLSDDNEDIDLFVLETINGTCDHLKNLRCFGIDSVIFEAEAGKTYTVITDMWTPEAVNCSDCGVLRTELRLQDPETMARWKPNVEANAPKPANEVRACRTAKGRNVAVMAAKAVAGPATRGIPVLRTESASAHPIAVKRPRSSTAVHSRLW